MIHIRQAKEDDIDAIERMYRDRVAFNNEHKIPQWRYDQVTWDALSELYAIKDYYVGVANHEIVCGCFIVDVDLLYWPDEPKGAALYLHKIVVHPAQSGLGYADALISFFKTKGEEEGFPCVRIDVRAQKAKLRAMYERNGFILQRIAQFVPEFETALYQVNFDEKKAGSM